MDSVVKYYPMLFRLKAHCFKSKYVLNMLNETYFVPCSHLCSLNVFLKSLLKFVLSVISNHDHTRRYDLKTVRNTKPVDIPLTFSKVQHTVEISIMRSFNGQ